MRLAEQGRLLNDYMSQTDELKMENEKVDNENKSLQYVKSTMVQQI